MSHTTKIQSVPINSVTALRAAALSLKAQGINCDLVQEPTARMYFDDQGQDMDYVLRLHDCEYDVGFQKEDDGSLTPAIDEWGGHVKKILGTGGKGAQAAIGRLLREYSKELTLESAAEQGYMVESCELDTEGNYQIVLAVD